MKTAAPFSFMLICLSATVFVITDFVADEARLNSNFISRSLRKRDKKSKLPNFPKRFAIEPVVDIPLPKGACFLSCLIADPSNDTDLTCYFREHYRKAIIGKIVLDGETFRIKSPIARNVKMTHPNLNHKYSIKKNSLTKNPLQGEDPRSFVWNDKVYVLNNQYMKNVLIQVNNDGSTNELAVPDYIGMKNITPIPIPGKGILFIDFQDRRTNICVPNTERKELSCNALWKKVDWKQDDRDTFNYEIWHHRGGTAGIQVGKGIYVGFGHMTHKRRKHHHDIWFWKLDMSGEKASISYSHVIIDHDIDHGITDPTSLVYINNEWYLFTVESDDVWRKNDVKIINRVYRLVEIEETPYTFQTSW